VSKVARQQPSGCRRSTVSDAFGTKQVREAFVDGGEGAISIGMPGSTTAKHPLKG
jgi:hypothetical protein